MGDKNLWINFCCVSVCVLFGHWLLVKKILSKKLISNKSPTFIKSSTSLAFLTDEGQTFPKAS